MSRWFAVIVGSLILTGCTPSKYEYMTNPYANPVVQQSYEEWLEGYGDTEERIVMRQRSSEILQSRYGNFLVTQEGLHQKVENQRNLSQEYRYTHFCQISSACKKPRGEASQ